MAGAFFINHDENAEQAVTTVFLAGSRSLTHLDEMVKERLDNVVEKGLAIVIGDANGADKAFQKYLANRNYRRVTIYCSGDTCRNNLGDWSTQNVLGLPLVAAHSGPAAAKAVGRAFFAYKDRKMAEDADYGLLLWDGKSAGTMPNVIEMLRRRKKTLVYVAATRDFIAVNGITDAFRLLQIADTHAKTDIEKKIAFSKTLREIERATQGSLAL